MCSFFSSRALRAQTACFLKISSSWIVFLGACLVFGAASGCKTLLFATVFYHGKNASRSKIFKKNGCSLDSRAPGRRRVRKIQKKYTEKISREFPPSLCPQSALKNAVFPAIPRFLGFAVPFFVRPAPPPCWAPTPLRSSYRAGIRPGPWSSAKLTRNKDTWKEEITTERKLQNTDDMHRQGNWGPDRTENGCGEAWPEKLRTQKQVSKSEHHGKQANEKKRTNDTKHWSTRFLAEKHSDHDVLICLVPHLFTSLMFVGLSSCIEGCSWARVAGNTVMLEPKLRGAVRTYTGKVFATQAAGGPAAFQYVRGWRCLNTLALEPGPRVPLRMEP